MEKQTIEYVLGFAFDKESANMVVMEKNRPAFQKGLLNGIGGKIEATDMLHGLDYPEDYKKIAIAREFLEETGVRSLPCKWDYFACMTIQNDVMGGTAVIHCLRMFDDKIHEVKTMETEKVFIADSLDIIKHGNETMPNLPLLTKIAMNKNIQFSTLTLEK